MSLHKKTYESTFTHIFLSVYTKRLPLKTLYLVKWCMRKVHSFKPVRKLITDFWPIGFETWTSSACRMICIFQQLEVLSQTFRNSTPSIRQIVLTRWIYRLLREDMHHSPADINYFQNNLQEVIINPEAQVGFQYGALVKAGFIMLTFRKRTWRSERWRLTLVPSFQRLFCFTLYITTLPISG